MRVQLLAKICSGQDGAIWGSYFFRFQRSGECCVYEVARLLAGDGAEVEPFSTFRLDKAEMLLPHSNAVSFGSEYAAGGDEFPLLYSNVYNSYAKSTDRMEGTCCVYRVQRRGKSFTTQLLQVIRIGFAAEKDLWRSQTVEDVRPYGNFVVDRERAIYHAFTMLDGEKVTRHFSCRLPGSDAGAWDGQLGVRCVTLTQEDIVDRFDCPYQHYLQGACIYAGRIYSLEGFANNEENLPALRVIDPSQRCQIEHISLREVGLHDEPEWIDFYEGQCIYADHSGNVYRIL